MKLPRLEGPHRTAAVLTMALALGGPVGCSSAVTSHPVQHATIGVVRSASAMEKLIDVPGPVVLETVVAADWEIDRAGLVNLDHPRAQAAGVEDAPEPIQIYFHALRHPDKGLYIVDSGVEHAQWADPDNALLRGVVGSFMNLDKMLIRVDTKTWLARQGVPLAGVFLTHLHIDHIAGLRDVPPATPLYAGPGETTATSFQNTFVSSVTDAAFEGKEPIRTWQFGPDADRRFDGVLDVFGDGTVWAISVPGHTPGSTAYLARTPKGPVLMTGDTCHTSWGWENGVEPGGFTSDHPKNAESLERLRALVKDHPAIDVRLGHQPMKHALGAGFD